MVNQSEQPPVVVQNSNDGGDGGTGGAGVLAAVALVAIILVGIWWFGFGPNSGGAPPSDTTDQVQSIAPLPSLAPASGG